MGSSHYPRVHGVVVPKPRRGEGAIEAVDFALRAANRKPTWNNVALNIFCDASRQTDKNAGGYAATFFPWMPSQRGCDRLVEAAWPIDPLYDVNLGELIAIAKSVAIVIQEIRDNREALVERDKAVTMTVFSDSNTSLSILDGLTPSEPLWTLVQPVARLIEKQSHALAALGPTVRLFFRWVPGHEHNIWPHQRADLLARTAQEVQRSYSPRYGNTWKTYMESPTMRWLKQGLLQASLRSAAIWPKLKHRLRHPRALPSHARCRNALQVYLDGVLPALDMTAMPAQWADSWDAVLTRKNGRRDIEVSVPLTRSNPRVFVNDGTNSFAVVLDDPTPPVVTAELVLYGTGS